MINLNGWEMIHLFSGFAYAQDSILPIRITAEEAFDVKQLDPENVALVDVRSRAEYFWVGATCQADEIITEKGSFSPDIGKVLVTKGGRFLEFYVNGKYKRLNTKKVAELKLSPIAINIPFKHWDEFYGELKKDPSPYFENEVLRLVDSGYDTVIFFCRSGGRSQDCLAGFDPTTFVNSFPGGVYEIDQPDEENGRGGFEGTSYHNIYNGYRGFPGRKTDDQDHPSVSWKDTGLPIKTSVHPDTLPNSPPE